jgi:signal transduction histidine kinase
MNNPSGLSIARPAVSASKQALSERTPAVESCLRNWVIRVFGAALFLVFSVALSSTALNGRGWAKDLDMERVGPILGMTTVSMSLLGSWLGFMRWREDRNPRWGRLAVAIPCLVWASQSISAPVLFGESVDRQVPSLLRIAAGLVGTWLVLYDVVRPEATFANSSCAKLGLALSSVGILAVVFLAIPIPSFFPEYSELKSQTRLALSTRGFPVVWGLVGLVISHRSWRDRDLLGRSLGLTLVLLALAQAIGSPFLRGDDAGRALATGCIGIFSVAALLSGIVCDMAQAVNVQRGRLIAAQFDVAQKADLLEGERLAHSVKAHDQKAALLAIEAVIGLLEGSEALEPSIRTRLCDAATTELQRLRSSNSASSCAEIELAEAIEPIVSLACVAGANVTCRIRAGLLVIWSAELTDVIRNLISNAVRHGHNTEVRIDARRLDYEAIELSVQDFGPGVASARRFDLFEPGRSSGGSESSGLGLHSARQILRGVGGDLVLDRNHVGGARFVARIPAANGLKSVNAR